MKKHLTLILALAAMASLTGCKDKLPPTKWDYPNENIVIYVTNSAGKDILTKGSDIFKNKIKIIYDGTTYELTTPATRANAPELPEMKGVRWVEVMWENQNNYLLFGEFSIDTKNYKGETFTIDWGDGTTNEVKFDLYATPNGDYDQPTISMATWLDGKSNSSNSLGVTIKK